MPKINVRWQRGWRFDGHDSKGMPVDIDGTQHLGVKPSDLLPIAMAACSATDLVIQCEELGTKLTSLRVDASYSQQPDAPWTFQPVPLHSAVAAAGLYEEDVARAIVSSEEELRSVTASVRPTVAIESTFELRAG
jgi:uncharacterized OsmC-like protein